MRRGKKYLEALKKIDKNKQYGCDEGLNLLKKIAFANFDESVDVAFRLNLDPRQADQNLRGALVLPHGTGKTKRVVVITDPSKLKEAEESGADKFGDDDLINEIGKGYLDFDVIVATPSMMGKLGKLGRLLGPKGLMPNPKTGTVTNDITKAVKEIKNGKIEYRVDKVGIIHASIGRKSFDKDKLKENLTTLYNQLIKIKPSTVKGTYIKSLTISSSMGPGITLSQESLKK